MIIFLKYSVTFTEYFIYDRTMNRFLSILEGFVALRSPIVRLAPSVSASASFCSPRVGIATISSLRHPHHEFCSGLIITQKLCVIVPGALCWSRANTATIRTSVVWDGRDGYTLTISSVPTPRPRHWGCRAIGSGCCTGVAAKRIRRAYVESRAC